MSKRSIETRLEELEAELRDDLRAISDEELYMRMLQDTARDEPKYPEAGAEWKRRERERQRQTEGTE